MGEGRILVQATVTAVGDDHYLYPCCIQCYSKVLEDVQCASWRCMKCGESYMSENLQWRYRLRLTTADTNEYRQVSVFGRTVEPFFGASANTFHRFLNHLQETQCDMADTILKQAVNLVFIGRSFMFGFASVRNHRHDMTVSCLSHAAENKGSNFDLIAVQMISPDLSHMTTVSDQITWLLKEMVSSSFHQVSLQENREDTTTEIQLKERNNCSQIAQKCFGSILETSENDSVNSLVSILFSCENSLVKNATMSPSSFSTDSLRLDMTTTITGQSQETLCNAEFLTEETIHNLKSEDASRTSELEDDFDETMNDSSLLLADKVLDLQTGREELTTFPTDINSLSANKETSDKLMSSEHLQVFRDEKCSLDVESLSGSENVWEDMPYSEDLDEFLSKAYDCSRSVTGEQKKGKQSMKDNMTHHGRNNQMCDVGVSNRKAMPIVEIKPMDLSSRSHADSKGIQNSSNMRHDTQDYLEFGFKLKQESNINEISYEFGHKPSKTFSEMPESENLDDFLLMAAYSSNSPETSLCLDSNTDQMSRDQHIFLTASTSHLQDQLTKPCDVTSSRNITQSHQNELGEEMPHSACVMIDNAKDISSVSERCHVPSNVGILKDSTVPEADFEDCSVDSFSQDDDCTQVLPSASVTSGDKTEVDSKSSSTFRNAEEATASKSNNNLVVELDGIKEPITPEHKDLKDETFGYGDPIVPFDKMSNGLSSSSEMKPKSSLEGRYGAPSTSECIVQKEKSVPVHLFHSVGSVGSLNGSMELFDASGDLFEDIEEDLQCVTKVTTSSMDHFSAVCDSVDDSVKISPSKKNIHIDMDSHKKKVKFAKRLSHISSVQLIDIRMKLNFGIPSESQLTPVKSCLRNVQSESGTFNKCNRPSFTTEPYWNPLLSYTNNTTPRPSETSEVDTDFTMSQDLFACSQTSDCVRLPSLPDCMSDENYPPNMDDEVSPLERPESSSSPSSSTCGTVSDTQVLPSASPQDNPLSKKVHGNVACRLFKVEIQDKVSFPEAGIHMNKRQHIELENAWITSDRHPDMTKDVNLTPCDGSQVLFTQLEYPFFETQRSSTPTADSVPEDKLLLSLTPDLFTP